MKKIISLLATVAMVSTLFVSVVKADVQPTVTTAKSDKLENAEFKALTKIDIPSGYDAYLLTVDFSTLGNLSSETSFLGESGRQIQGFSYTLTFDNKANLNATYTALLTKKFNNVNLSKGWDGNSYRVIFNGGTAADAYPNDDVTYSNASISEVLKFLVVTSDSTTVTASIASTMNFVTYEDDTAGVDEPKNSLAGTITMTPASYEFAPAPAGVAPVETVATVAEDATGLTDLNGDAVTLDADYGIAKFDTPINTALNKYYIVAKTATETSPDFLVDFSGAVEAAGNVAFYAIVKSTHGAITSLTLKAVANE